MYSTVGIPISWQYLFEGETEEFPMDTTVGHLEYFTLSKTV